MLESRFLGGMLTLICIVGMGSVMLCHYEFSSQEVQQCLFFCHEQNLQQLLLPQATNPLCIRNVVLQTLVCPN